VNSEGGRAPSSPTVGCDDAAAGQFTRLRLCKVRLSLALKHEKGASATREDGMSRVHPAFVEVAEILKRRCRPRFPSPRQRAHAPLGRES
jgi:hypothetical protein